MPIYKNLGINNLLYKYRKNYPDKSSCYECGQEGHLSYNCPLNALGERLPPPKKNKKKRKAEVKMHNNPLYYYIFHILQFSVQ